MKQIHIVAFILFLFPKIIFSQSDSDPTFPITADGFTVQLFARDPMVRNPCAITFDAQGRLTVGMGPQYRKPKPETPGDSVYILEDTNNDGEADRKIEFATGFNNIQGLLWDRDQLYIANAPDFTVVRDIDNDGKADVYTKLYTDLGNLEHGLHGLNWGPDGYLYMSKGNSKGLTQPPNRIAPGPFRKLWGIDVDGLPDFPDPKTYSGTEYKRAFHDPSDDWGRQGGILRCQPDGSGLEIFAAGFRNPWDIAFDSSFNWLGTDNDQNLGDKIFSPFYGAHFGWGHEWSSDWAGENHLPTLPRNGPLFEGSGTGVTWWNPDGVPDEYKGVFLINDWLTREVLVYKPEWDGARMRPSKTPLEILATAERGRDMSRSDGRSFDPVDIEIGPDGSIYISSWGREYGAVFKDNKFSNEGRIYKLTHSDLKMRSPVVPSKFTSLTNDALIGLFADEHIQVRLRLLQQELIKRIKSGDLEVASTFDHDLPEKTRTWLIHAASLAGDTTFLRGELNRSNLLDKKREQTLIQVIRSLSKQDFIDSKVFFMSVVGSDYKRVSHEICVGVHRHKLPWHQLLVKALSEETDRLVYYTAWRALGEICSQKELIAYTKASHPRVRLGALLGLLEEDMGSDEVVSHLTKDPDSIVANIAKKWMSGKDSYVIKGKPLLVNSALKPDAKESRELYTVFINGAPKIYAKQSSGEFSWSLVEEGAETYTDRSYALKNVPEKFCGMLLLKTSNADDRNKDVKLNMTIDKNASLYVCHDRRVPKKYHPQWLRSFKKLDHIITNEDSEFDIFYKDVSPGEIALGANWEGTENPTWSQAQYFVFMDIPGFTVTRKKSETNIEDSIKLLASADKQRGKNLFFNRDGAACAKCHRLEGVGNAFAPDLNDIGKRVSAEFIVQSIIDPDAHITEGFHQSVIETKGGGVYSGILLSESGRNVRVALMSGDLVSVPTLDISSRTVLKASGMPSYFKALLSSRDVADITAYLLSASTAQSDVIEGGSWRIEKSAEKLDIFYQRKLIATYVMQHPKLTRPALVNVHTLSGEPVTRKFPAGPDADHQYMHPGLSVSFGWISGNDYWRMKSPVNHIGFVKQPAIENGVLEFEVKNAYLSKNQKATICFELLNLKLKPLKKGQLHVSWNSKFYNDQNSFIFGDQEESGLAFRISEDLNVKSGNGRITNDMGMSNGSGTWGKPFSWIEYSGIRNKKRIGAIIKPRPTNQRKCWAHSRDYGVLVANPFPRQDREQRTPLRPTQIAEKSVYDLSYEMIIFESSPEILADRVWK